jgi:hypothetical protein
MSSAQVMKRLFWSFDPVMSTVHPSEAWVTRLRGQIEEALRRSIESLHAYMKVYEAHLPFLKLDQIEYMKQVRSAPRRNGNAHPLSGSTESLGDRHPDTA